MSQPTSHPLNPILHGRSVVVVGAGKVGVALATLLGDAGLTIAAVTAGSSANAEKAAARLGVRAELDNAAAAASGDIVLVTVNDDSVAAVVADVAAAGGFRSGQLVVHTSGALPLSALAPAAEARATIGCMHPLQSFATVGDALRLIPGSTFGITPGPGARETIEALVGVLGGQSVLVADENRALYHAAAVSASNYLVAVQDLAVELLVDAGFDEPSALASLQPLVSGTADNVRALGTTGAVTGPIVRGDVATVRSHVDALRGLSGNALELYRALGRRTLEIALRRGTLTAETVASLEAILDDKRRPTD